MNKQTISETQQINTFLNALFARTHAVNKTIIVKVSFCTQQVMLGLSGTFLSQSGSFGLNFTKWSISYHRKGANGQKLNSGVSPICRSKGGMTMRGNLGDKGQEPSVKIFVTSNPSGKLFVSTHLSYSRYASEKVFISFHNISC